MQAQLDGVDLAQASASPTDAAAAALVPMQPAFEPPAHIKAGGKAEPPQQHGGWMPRTAALGAHVYNRRWEEAEALNNFYYNKYGNYAAELDRALKRG